MKNRRNRQKGGCEALSIAYLLALSKSKVMCRPKIG